MFFPPDVKFLKRILKTNKRKEINMIRENQLTLALKKRKTAFLLSVVAGIYFFSFAFLENPLHSTISDIGRTRLPFLAIYCILIPLFNIVNFNYTLRAFRLKAPVLRRAFLISNVLVGFVATTLMPDPAVGKVTTFSVLLHWLAGFGNIVLNATVVLIICYRLYRRTKSKKVKTLFISGTAACLAILVVFVVMTLVLGGTQKSKNGLYEIVPVVTTGVVLFVLNHTNIISPKKMRDSEEKALKAQDTSLFTAVSHFFLAAAWLFFTFYAFVRNPVNFTISMTGLDYPLGFGVTCALISVGLSLNFILAFRRSGYKNIFTYIVAVGGSLVLTLCVAAPTTHRGDGLNLVHSVAAVAFFILIMVAVILFCLFKRRENKLYTRIALGMLVILALTLIVAYVMNILLEQRYGRTGLVEIIPLQYVISFLFFENYTDAFMSENKLASSEKTKV